MPPRLAMGPCIEEWADSYVPRPWQRDGRESAALAFHAWRCWQAAVDEWAVASGWASESRPAHQARLLARARHPWSRDFLVEQGRAALVAYYETGLAQRH